MAYSFVITSDSAWTTRLQSCPALSSAFEMTMNPPPTIPLSVVLGADALWYCSSQLAPCVMTIRWLNCFCGAHAVHGLFGCHSAVIEYWSRSMEPVPVR